MTFQVELVDPEGEIWSGSAEMIIARTKDGEIGILTNHAPIIGILAEGSTVQIRPEGQTSTDVFAAVSGGFLSVADNQVAILARQSQLGSQVHVADVQAALDQALGTAGAEESDEVRYYRALLQIATEGSRAAS
jgi:F-type H+-transporting ATPase subunit epsilon